MDNYNQNLEFLKIFLKEMEAKFEGIIDNILYISVPDYSEKGRFGFEIADMVDRYFDFAFEQIGQERNLIVKYKEIPIEKWEN